MGLSIPKAIVPEFFGIHFASSYAGSRLFGQRSERLWDAGVPWRKLEISKGVWNWSLMDSLVSGADSRSADVLYTLGQPPIWATGGIGTGLGASSESYNASPPTNDQDWSDYINALIDRYGDRIKIWEIWNEWELGSFYNGTVERLVQLAAIAYPLIKSRLPNAIVLTTSTQAGTTGSAMTTYMAAGGGPYCDGVAIHGYLFPSDPQGLFNFRMMNLRARLMAYGQGDKPIHNTEWTYHSFLDPVTGIEDTMNMMSDDMAADYLITYWLWSVITGIERCYFYTVGDGGSWSRIDLSGVRCNAAMVRFIGLMTGGKIYNARQHGSTHYSARFECENGQRGRVIWGQPRQATMNFDLTPYRRAYDVVGAPTQISSSVAIGRSPIFAFL